MGLNPQLLRGHILGCLPLGPLSFNQFCPLKYTTPKKLQTTTSKMTIKLNLTSLKQLLHYNLHTGRIYCRAAVLGLPRSPVYITQQLTLFKTVITLIIHLPFIIVLCCIQGLRLVASLAKTVTWIEILKDQCSGLHVLH